MKKYIKDMNQGEVSNGWKLKENIQETNKKYVENINQGEVAHGGQVQETGEEKTEEK